ncbi:MAG: hypothetical protein ACO1SV_05610 [Fimbriimonas sp.]
MESPDATPSTVASTSTTVARQVPVLQRRWLQKSADFLVIVGIVGSTLGMPFLAFLIEFQGWAVSLFALLYWQGLAFLLVHLYHGQQRRLRREIAERVRSLQGVDVQGQPFVTLYAYSEGRLCDRDVGFVLADDSGLRFCGDRLSFHHPKDRIDAMHPISPSGLRASGVRIEWKEDDQARALEFRPKGVLSPSRKRMAAQSLEIALRFRRL